jgi:hypothetical protein
VYEKLRSVLGWAMIVLISDQRPWPTEIHWLEESQSIYKELCKRSKSIFDAITSGNQTLDRQIFGQQSTSNSKSVRLLPMIACPSGSTLYCYVLSFYLSSTKKWVYCSILKRPKSSYWKLKFFVEWALQNREIVGPER